MLIHDLTELGYVLLVTIMVYARKPEAGGGIYGRNNTTGSTTWGHVTGVTETNTAHIYGNWTGTGTISGSGDSETIVLDATEYMISEVVNTGAKTIELDQNHYASGNDVNMDWRTGATAVACEADDWNDYTAPFASEGFVQVKLTSTL